MNSIQIMELGACWANFGTCGCFGFIFWPEYLFFLLVWVLIVVFKPCPPGSHPIHLAFRAMVSRLLEKQAAGAHKFSCELLWAHKNQFPRSVCSPLTGMVWADLLQSCEVTCWHCFFQLRAGICSSSSSRFSNFLVCFQEVIFLLSV